MIHLVWLYFKPFDEGRTEIQVHQTSSISNLCRILLVLIVVTICHSHSICFFTKAFLRDESNLGLHQLTKRNSGIFRMYTLQSFDGHTVIFKGELAPNRLQNSRFNYHKIGFQGKRAFLHRLSCSPFLPLLQALFSTACVLDERKIGDFLQPNPKGCSSF